VVWRYEESQQVTTTSSLSAYGDRQFHHARHHLYLKLLHDASLIASIKWQTRILTPNKTGARLQVTENGGAMKRRHIALFADLGNGHVYPALGMCMELVKRGYRVTWATDEHYVSLVRQAGAEALLYEPARLEGMQEQEIDKALEILSPHDPKWWMMFASVIYPWFLVLSMVMLPQIENFYKNDIPDLIIYDRNTFAARILAKRLGCPAILTYPHFAYYKKFLYRDNGVCVNPEPILAFSSLLDSFFRAHGIQETDNLWHTEKLNIYFLPKEFQFHSDSFDDRSCFVGACLDRPLQPTWKNVSNGRPIILISDASYRGEIQYFKLFMEALGDSKYHVILSIGKHISDESLGTLPHNFEINKFASHLEILPHAVLSICQGGMNSVLEAIYHGVPLICLPPTSGHLEVAYRVTELGLGLHLTRRELSADLIRTSVDRVLGDAKLLNRVKHMQELFIKSDGAKLAVDCIERFLSLDHAI
jgi:MGT family glycosyltransferase